MDNVDYDVAVIGAGINGLCTAYALSKTPGLRILLLEQFDLEHCEGSSHSQIRITRAAYTDPLYAMMANQVRNVDWPQLQGVLKEKLVYDNDFVSFGEDEIWQKYKQLAVDLKLPTLTLISGQEAQKRFPALKLGHFKEVILDANAGIIHASKVIQSLIRHLRSKNITILTKTQVLGVESCPTHATIKTQTKNFKVGKVILTAGRWISKLEPELADVLHVNEQTILYMKLKTEKKNIEIGKYPSWMSSEDGHEFYSLPGFGDDWVKIAQHDNQITKDKLPQQKQIQRVSNFAKTVFTYPIQSLQKTQKCYYTSTKTQQFIIDFSDQHKRIVLSSTCSGHSFKFGPLTGRILSELALTGQCSIPCFKDNKHRFSIFYHKGVNLM